MWAGIWSATRVAYLKRRTDVSWHVKLKQRRSNFIQKRSSNLNYAKVPYSQHELNPSLFRPQKSNRFVQEQICHTKTNVEMS